MKAGVKVFSGMSVKDHPTIIDDKHSPDLSNCRVDNPLGALSNMEGISKYNSVGFGASIVAIHQLNGHIFSLRGGSAGSASGKLYEGRIFEGYTAITNCVELQAMQNDLAGNYYLANDIDCTYCTQDPAGALYNAGAGFAPVGDYSNPFTGTFDGNEHTITGLKINRPSTAYIGLFSYINGAEIKNVGLINIDITGDHNIGGLVADIRPPDANIINNCYVTGSVSGNGGSIGGLLGMQNRRAITITNCYTTCSVSTGANYAGGLIGYNDGYGNDDTITNCYSAGAISGSNVGGLIGYNSAGTYNDCFWDTQTSGQATSGGGTGKTTAQMKQQATFENWNFSTIWAIVEDVSYPTLR